MTSWLKCQSILTVTLITSILCQPFSLSHSECYIQFAASLLFSFGLCRRFFPGALLPFSVFVPNPTLCVHFAAYPKPPPLIQSSAESVRQSGLSSGLMSAQDAVKLPESDTFCYSVKSKEKSSVWLHLRLDTFWDFTAWRLGLCYVSEIKTRGLTLAWKLWDMIYSLKLSLRGAMCKFLLTLRS